MELRQYRYFVAAASRLHFSQAADDVGISPPSMTKQIQEIERELGVRLFQRTKRKVFLTAAGEIFLQDARRLLSQVERAEDTARRAGRGEAGCIAVGYVASTAYVGLLQREAMLYRKSHPGVDLRFHEVDMDRLPEMLDDGRIDIAFLRPPMTYPASVMSMTLLRDPFVVALPRGHRLASQQRIKPSQLEKETFVLPEQIAGTLEVGRRGGFKPNLGPQPGRLTAVITYVSLGAGVAIVPGSLRHAVNIGRVVYRGLTAPPILSEIAVAYRRSEWSPATRGLIAQIRKSALSRTGA